MSLVGAVSDNCARVLLLFAALPVLTGQFPLYHEVVSVVGSTASSFLSHQQTDVFVASGEPARLSCSVKNVQDKSVLWVRVRDLHILSFDKTVFTADPRFSVRVDNGSYLMDIKHAKVTDSGSYECQINTEPKMSLLFNLTVFDQPMPKLKIWISGPSEQSTIPGHTMTFTCEARYMWKNTVSPPANFPLPPINIHWLHENQPITLQTDRGGILVDTDRSTFSATSRLTVASVTSRDEGYYTCVAGQRKERLLFKLMQQDENGEDIAAMQRDQSQGNPTDAAVIAASSPAMLFTASLLAYRLRFLLT